MLHLLGNKWRRAEPKWVSAHSMEEHAGVEHVIGIYGPGGEPDAGGFIRLV